MITKHAGNKVIQMKVRRIEKGFSLVTITINKEMVWRKKYYAVGSINLFWGKDSIYNLPEDSLYFSVDFYKKTKSVTGSKMIVSAYIQQEINLGEK